MKAKEMYKELDACKDKDNFELKLIELFNSMVKDVENLSKARNCKSYVAKKKYCFGS